MLSEKSIAESKLKDSRPDAWDDLCAVWFDDPEQGLIAVLVVYSDASYNQPTGRDPNPSLFYTVGCYFGHVDNWRKFRKEWRTELRKWGIDDFHMNKFERARNVVIQGNTFEASNPYFGWKVEDFDEFLGRMHQILRRKTDEDVPRLDGLGFSIKKADFDSMLPPELKDDPGCQSYYMFCVAVNMQNVAILTRFYNHAGEIHYIFAGGDGEGGRLENFFRSLWKNDIARKHFALSKSFTRLGYDIAWAADEPALQAADVAAYEYNKLAVHCDAHGITEPSQIDPSILRKSLLSLCRPPSNHFPLLLSGDRMRYAFDGMAAWKKRYGSPYAEV